MNAQFAPIRVCHLERLRRPEYAPSRVASPASVNGRCGIRRCANGVGGSLERNGAFAPYLARRLFRLIPPFAAAVLFAFACERLLRLDPAPSGLTPGFVRMFWPQPTWDELWANLLLGSYHVNGPTWTLYPELLGSLLLPFVVAAHGRIAPRWRWALFAAIATLLAIGPYHTLLWFYFGCFLVKEFAALLANRQRLAPVMFLAGLAGLEIAGTYNASVIVANGSCRRT